MRITRTLTAIALAMGLAAPVLAQEGEYMLDADEDGTVTEEEWGAYGESFGEADADQSGFVDEDEWGQWSQTNWGGEPGGGDDDGPLWGLLDVNADSQVDENEWFGEEGFAGLDDDESGDLNEEEFGVE